MSNKVDKLFKDKLSEHSLPPSAQAWGKIEANLAKKNKGIIWFRIAAVLALFGLLTFVWIRNGNDKDMLPQMANKKPAEVKKKNPELNNKKKEEKPFVARNTSKEEKQGKTASKKEKQTIIQQEPVSAKTNDQTAVALMEEKKVEVPVITNEVNTAQVKTQKSIKLTFSLPSLKADTQEPEQAIAATPEEKKSTLQKAVNDIRTGDVLGSLRDAKDDLFAWEFKKDKTKKTTLN